MKLLNDVIKYLNSMFSDSILKFVRQKDKSIKIVLGNDKYLYLYSVVLDECFYNKLQNVLFYLGINEIRYDDKEENVFRCFDNKGYLIWK